MRAVIRRRTAPAQRARGFTLIELMIAMLLGLLVISAAGAIFVSNRQTYVATESLGRVQESARVAFELMARDLREAGGNPCDRRTAVVSVLEPAMADWWANWDIAVMGYGPGDAMAGLTSGSATEDRVGTTDAIELKSAHTGVAVESHTAGTALFEVDSADSGLAAGDLAVVCDYTQASLFEVSSVVGGTNPLVSHDVGGSNCTKGLGLPVSCDGGTGTIYIYPANSTIAKVSATRWYVGNNAQGGQSLFRQTRRSSASGVASEEVVRGVAGMALTYLVPGNPEYVAASAVAGTQWGEVTAVRVVLELEGDDRVGSNGQPITRRLAYVASLRNRTI